MTTLTDAEILARLRAGDMTACAACVDAHSDELYRLAYRIVHDEQSAEDIVQDTFLNAFRGLDNFDGRSSLGTWLFRITYNNALMRLRREKPAETLDEETEQTEQEFTPIVVPWRETPEEMIMRDETAQQLQTAISELPVTLRTVFQLRDIQERSTGETAEILGISQTAVKVRLHRARLLLREKLSAYFGTSAAPHPSSMTCDELTPYLSEYLDNAVPEPLAAAAREHIANCPRCHVLLDTTQMTITMMQHNAVRVIPAADRAMLFNEIQKAFAERRRRLAKTKPAG